MSAIESSGRGGAGEAVRREVAFKKEGQGKLHETEVTFEQKPEGGEGVSQVYVWEKKQAVGAACAKVLR